MTAKKTVEKPVPTQAKADDIRDEAAVTDAEPATETDPTKAKPSAAPTPSPTQAELDAIRAGSYDNREMKSG
jgi:hypothetical protein